MDLKQRVEQLEREKQALINMHENYYGEALQRAEFAKKETQAVWDRCQEEIKELTAREDKLVEALRAIRNSALYASADKEFAKNIINSIDCGFQELGIE